MTATEVVELQANFETLKRQVLMQHFYNWRIRGVLQDMFDCLLKVSDIVYESGDTRALQLVNDCLELYRKEINERAAHHEDAESDQSL